ncbi:MAG: Cthe_2314 family HEPN domain-containing protein [Pseudomonadota bacterium]
MGDDEPLEIERAIILDAENPLKNIDTRNNQVPINSELDKYIYNCSQALSAISSAIDKVKISIIMLENSRDLLPEDSPYNEAEHIEYAIENYFIRSSCLYDRCLIFTVKLLDLGVSNENVTHKVIITNEHVKNNDLCKALKKISKACREFSTERNKIIHHGSYNDESFLTVSAVHKVNQLSVGNGSEPPFGQEVIDYFTNKAIEEKKINFNAHLDKIRSDINSFFEKALPIYTSMKERRRRM